MDSPLEMFEVDNNETTEEEMSEVETYDEEIHTNLSKPRTSKPIFSTSNRRLPKYL